MGRPRRAPLLTTVILGLALALALAACGSTSAVSVPVVAAPATVRHTLTAADGQRLDATEQAAAERPAIAASAARARADAAVPNSARATAVDARFVALILDSDRTIRNVWLVTYSGVEFTPSGCTCHVDLTTPNTVVAVDGQTGAVALIFGADAEQ